MDEKRLVLMAEPLFNQFIALMERQNGKKYKVEWGERVGHDPVTNESMYVPTVFDVRELAVGHEESKDDIVDGE